MLHLLTTLLTRYINLFYTILISKDNEAARRRRRRRIVPYVEEADDDANKVSQKKRIGIRYDLLHSPPPSTL